MTLTFTTTLNQKPSNFVSKILEGLEQNDIIKNEEKFNLVHNYVHTEPGHFYLETVIPKLHTIRRDSANLWKEGNKIHFVINPYNKNRLQFAPVLRVKSIQKIRIENVLNGRNTVYIDDRKLSDYEILQLSVNDGFDSVDDFWNFFRMEHFEGKLIHWTNLKY